MELFDVVRDLVCAGQYKVRVFKYLFVIHAISTRLVMLTWVLVHVNRLFRTFLRVMHFKFGPVVGRWLAAYERVVLALLFSKFVDV